MVQTSIDIKIKSYVLAWPGQGRLGQNRTFVLKSTGGFAQGEWVTLYLEDLVSSCLLFGRSFGLALVLLLEGGGLLRLELPDEGLGGADLVARRQKATGMETQTRFF